MGRRKLPDDLKKPVRSIRAGKVWDDARTAADEDGEKFAVLVERALRAELTRRARRRRRTATTPQPAESPRPPADYTPYGERKPYTVADNLDELTGPTGGVVSLPHHLNWSGKPVYDLDAPNRLTSMYKTVLAEASTVDDLRAWINKDRLMVEWPRMFLPPKVRRLWEERFPELAALSTLTKR
jgi:hypothetical protein